LRWLTIVTVEPGDTDTLVVIEFRSPAMILAQPLVALLGLLFGMKLWMVALAALGILLARVLQAGSQDDEVKVLVLEAVRSARSRTSGW